MNKTISFTDQGFTLYIQQGENGVNISIDAEGDDSGYDFVIDTIEKWEEIKHEIDKFFPPKLFGGREQTFTEKGKI